MAETETSTPEPGPASETSITLDGVLESAIGGEFTGGEPESTPSEPRPLAGESSAEDIEVQPDSSEESAEGQDDVEVTATPDAEPVPDALSAPKTWPAEHREAFEHLPEDQQDFMLKREHERDAAFTRKTTQLSEQRRELAQHYGVSLSSGDSGVDWNEETNSDPQIQQLQQQLTQTQAHVQSMQQLQVNAQQQQLVDQVESFATVKDTKGNLKHPHFEKVRERMGRLVNAGETTDLEAAYSMALRLDDDLYKETIANERKDVAEKENGRRKAAVEKAKKSQPVRGSGAPPGGSVKPSDLDNILRNSIGSAASG